MGRIKARGRRGAWATVLSAFLVLTTTALAPAADPPVDSPDAAGPGDERPEAPPPKKWTFNSRFYAVTTDLTDKQLARDIAKHMDAVFMEYSSRMAGFRANPYAATKPGERMPLYVMYT